MKVRDLRQYIRTISNGKETLDLLGSDSEYFMEIMSGRGEQVDALITSAASFANNAKEQLFYEFVQNAYDANADSLFFYANENYLIVLNNGDPFYTDMDIFEKKGEDIRDGQLYNFLAKGKSLKLKRKEKLGKYGQGSKLLYTLLADIDHNTETEELLKDVIINQKKGPYLISWYNMSQLDALLINKDEWIPAQADDVENNILFAKILMSYYPIAPGQATNFFTNQEAQDAIKAFDELVDPKRNKNFLTRGTAIIVPLGKGKYDAIVSDANLENVRARLGAFASITADQERNFGKSLKHIYVMKQEIEQHPVRSLFVEFEEAGKKFEYHFAFNPIFAEKNVVNFFKGLPILQTKYRFGFILDSQILEVDDSRQRFTDIEKTCAQLRLAYKYLIVELEKLKGIDREKYDYIYKSIIASRLEDNSEDEQKIRKAFYEIIRPYLNENMLTSEGEYLPFDNVYEEEKEVNVLLSDLGIENSHWIDTNSTAAYRRHFDKKIKVYQFVDMLCDAEEDKLSSWIKSMSKEDYRLFHQNCIDCIISSTKEESDNDRLKDLPVFRSNKNNLFSYNELMSDDNVYYTSRARGNIFAGQEYIIEPYVNDYSEGDYLILFDKVKANIEILRQNSIGKDTVCNILSIVVDNIENDDIIKEIQCDIDVLQNRRGDFLPFSKLLCERPDNSILFDDFLVKGAIPETIKGTNWLVDKQEEKKSIWNWVYDFIDEIKKVDGWSENAHKYLSDLKKVYIDAGAPLAQKGLLHLSLDKNGNPTQKQCQNIEGFDRLSKDDYAVINKAFSDYSFVPYEFHNELTTPPFYLHTLNVNDLIDSGKKISFDVLSILSRISDNFFTSYRIIGTDDGDSFEVRPIGLGGKNYCDNTDNNIRGILTNIGFYYIPRKVQSLIPQNHINTFKITREDFARQIIDKVSDKLAIFPIIKQSTSGAIDHYLNSLSCFAIDSKLSQDSIVWQLIKFAASRNTDDNKYKSQIFELIRHDGEKLPETIKETFITFNGHEYDLYELDNDYKKEDSHIDSFLKCLPTDNDIEWFKNEFYGDKKESIEIDDIYENIHNTYLTVEQLRFCLDYSLNSDVEPDYFELKIEEDVNLSDALDMVSKNNFIGFDKFFKIANFEPEIQAYADKSILNEAELLPSNLYQWLSQNETSINLFNKLRTVSSNDSYLAIRRAIKLDEEFYSYLDLDNEELTKLTVRWLLDSNIKYRFGSNAFKAVCRLIEKLPDDIDPMVFLRYTGLTENTDDNIYPLFILEEYQTESCFYSSASWTPIFKEMLHSNRKVQKFFENNTVYLYEQLDLLSNHQLHKCPKLEVTIKANDGDYTEYNSPVYNKWKLMEESRGIVIKTSLKPIGISFLMNKERKEVFSVGIDDKNIGFVTNQMVVVKYPNEENLSVLKMIEKNIKDIEFFQEPFIVLQGLFVDQFEVLEKLAEENQSDISNIVQSYTGGANSIVKVDADKVSSVQELADSFDAEELMELADKKDKILEILHDMEDAEDETLESKVRQTIGYIGELIFEQYLKALNKEYKYAAIEGVGDYDFHNITDKTYIDVKTTLYSLKEGTAPFYLHRSQNTFMQKHPNENYRIVRISLNDLNLQKSYERIRDIYGKDANPLENERLNSDCKKIAQKYWGGAKIEEFDALSPEYSIRIEKK